MNLLEQQALQAVIDAASSLHLICDDLHRLVVAAELELESEKQERTKKGKQ